MKQKRGDETDSVLFFITLSITPRIDMISMSLAYGNKVADTFYGIQSLFNEYPD